MRQMLMLSRLAVTLMMAACAGQGTSGKDYAGQGQVVRDCPDGLVQVCTSRTPGKRGEDGSMAQSYDSCVCRIRQY